MPTWPGYDFPDYRGFATPGLFRDLDLFRDLEQSSSPWREDTQHIATQISPGERQKGILAQALV
jgi:hypothetical protein